MMNVLKAASGGIIGQVYFIIGQVYFEPMSHVPV